MDKQEPRFESAADVEAKTEATAESDTESKTIDAETAASDRPSGSDKVRSFPLAIYKPSTQYRRFALLAASLALAAAFGGLIGSLSTYSLATPKTDPAEPARKLQAALTQVTKDVAALKTSVDASNKSATNQMAKIGERLDRSEKALADPAAKMAALTETVSRIEKRLASTTTAAANDVTGSISTMAKIQNKDQSQAGGYSRAGSCARPVKDARWSKITILSMRSRPAPSCPVSARSRPSRSRTAAGLWSLRKV